MNLLARISATIVGAIFILTGSLAFLRVANQIFIVCVIVVFMCAGCLMCSYAILNMFGVFRLINKILKKEQTK